MGLLMAKLISLVVLIWCVRWIYRSCFGPKVGYWTYLEYLHLPISVVQDAVIECFGEGERFGKGDSTADFYTRGDTRIRRVSEVGQVRFSDIPSTFCVVVETERGKTLVTMRIEFERRHVKIPWSVAKQFDGPAKAEFEEAMRRLQQTAERMLSERDAERRRRSRQPTEPPMPSTGQDDYAALDLKPGATLEEVQAAYRAACRKYHPDRLNGQSVEPHLVELAVQRFKEVTAAYQRLKDRLGQPQHA